MLRPLHDTVPPANVPALEMFVGLLYPLGNRSPTPTPVASFGPALLTVIVNVTVSPGEMFPLPSASVSSVMLLLSDRSATGFTIGVAVASSSCTGGSLSGVGSGCESGSNWSLAVTSATFV